MAEQSRVQVSVIELVGGPHDGRQMVLSPGPDGMPLYELPIPEQPVDNLLYGPVLDVLPVPPEVKVTVYRRDVFAEARDCWIYRPVT